MTTLWIVTVLGGAYCFWRYSKKPFESLRASMVAEATAREAVNAALAELALFVKAELGQRKPMTFTDEDIARAEQRSLARRVWTAPPA